MVHNMFRSKTIINRRFQRNLKSQSKILFAISLECYNIFVAIKLEVLVLSHAIIRFCSDCGICGRVPKIARNDHYLQSFIYSPTDALVSCLKKY
jgi:hypothetical protein